ncbi:MAG: hypothetical protein KDI69_10400, partial [Xanthomonadales bacterium]|nr:hypothetical protein [Xanthomonadales bacterium]
MRAQISGQLAADEFAQQEGTRHQVAQTPQHMGISGTKKPAVRAGFDDLNGGPGRNRTTDT